MTDHVALIRYAANALPDGDVRDGLQAAADAFQELQERTDVPHEAAQWARNWTPLDVPVLGGGGRPPADHAANFIRRFLNDA